MLDEAWTKVETHRENEMSGGILLLDDCHNHIWEVNRLVERFATITNPHMKLILVLTKHHWNPRSKSPAIFTRGRGYEVSRLSGSEMNGLLDLLDRRGEVKALVEDRFLGFARAERRRRLEERCASDMFVCLKNIFGFESIDNIILREYADMSELHQEIYRTVSAMEAAGVKVHRQLIIRTLGIAAQSISGILDNLSDIVSEYTISEREGLYGWRCRHAVIAEIVTKWKFADEDETYRLYESIINNLNPTYELEIRTVRNMCDM